jgi:hypothetical protein
MPYEWLPPAEPLDDDDRVKAVAFLEGQARFELAVWVGYRTGPGHNADHELKLRLRGNRPGRDGLRTLFWGVSYSLGTRCYVGVPTHAEMRKIRRAGELTWERREPPPEGADPLDFRLSREPVELPGALRQQIKAAMEAFPEVHRVRIARTKMWKSDELFRENVVAAVECDGRTTGPGDPVGALAEILRSEFGASGVTRVDTPTHFDGSTNVYLRGRAPT